jgi:uncharacterized membrane protein YccC
MLFLDKLPALQDPRSKRYAIQLTLASVVAMIVANLFHITNPWWAAMAVWMVSQPTRGLLLERSLAQLVGTCIGAAAGVGMMHAFTQAWGLLLALSLWLALCCGVANLMRHQRAYGGVLAGLAAAVVVILGWNAGIDPAQFALARVLDTVIGIGASILFIALWNPMGAGAALVDRAQQVSKETLSLAAHILGHASSTELEARERKLLADLAVLEASSEDAASGSVNFRRQLRPLRGLLAALLDTLAVTRALRERADRHANRLSACAEALEQCAQAMALGVAERDAAVAALEESFGAARERHPVLAQLFNELSASLAAARSDYRALATALPRAAAGFAIAHPDFAGVRLAVVRSLVASLLTAALWVVSGSELARFLMLGACIFTTIFATADEPTAILRQVVVGAVGAGIAVLVWRAGLMHVLPNGYLSLLLAVPFIFAAAAVQAHRPTAFIGLALNMIFAVMAQPIHVHPAAAAPLTETLLALLTGIGISYACFRWIAPMSTAQRRSHLRRAMLGEIGAIAARAGEPRASRHLARMRYLTLDLLARVGASVELAHGALAALTVGHAALRIGVLLNEAGVTADAQDAASKALNELQTKGQSAHYVNTSLTRAAMQIESHAGQSAAMQELAQSLRDASACVARQPGFFE